MFAVIERTCQTNYLPVGRGPHELGCGRRLNGFKRSTGGGAQDVVIWGSRLSSGDGRAPHCEGIVRWADNPGSVDQDGSSTPSILPNPCPSSATSSASRQPHFDWPHRWRRVGALWRWGSPYRIMADWNYDNSVLVSSGAVKKPLIVWSIGENLQDDHGDKDDHASWK